MSACLMVPGRSPGRIRPILRCSRIRLTPSAATLSTRASSSASLSPRSVWSPGRGRRRRPSSPNRRTRTSSKKYFFSWCALSLYPGQEHNLHSTATPSVPFQLGRPNLLRELVRPEHRADRLHPIASWCPRHLTPRLAPAGWPLRVRHARAHQRFRASGAPRDLPPPRHQVRGGFQRRVLCPLSGLGRGRGPGPHSKQADQPPAEYQAVCRIWDGMGRGKAD